MGPGEEGPGDRHGPVKDRGERKPVLSTLVIGHDLQSATFRAGVSTPVLLSLSPPSPPSQCSVAVPGSMLFLKSLPLVLFPKVYNEQIHDLLEPKGPLTIREDPDKGVVVPGLSFHQVRAGPQVWQPLHWSSGVPSNGNLGIS